MIYPPVRQRIQMAEYSSQLWKAMRDKKIGPLRMSHERNQMNIIHGRQPHSLPECHHVTENYIMLTLNLHDVVFPFEIWQD
jgi:hypothetical protein